MGTDIKRAYNRVGIASRIMAFRAVVVFLLGTVVGSLAPESGTVFAYNTGFRYHAFNVVFLAVGIAGVVLALCLGFGKRV